MPLTTLALALGASFASGLNLYATVATLGLLHRFAVLQLPPALEPLAHPLVVGIALVLYLVEFVADKVPAVDSAWDVVHTFIRPPAGALLAYGAVASLPEHWRIVAALLAGGVALTIHGAKASARAAANTSPEPFSNWALSLGEDALAIAVLWLAATHPGIALVVVLVLLAAAAMVIVAFFRLLRAVLRRWLRGARTGAAGAALGLGVLLSAAAASAETTAVPPGDRRLADDVREGARAFAGDAWHVASSPARFGRRELAWLAGTAAIGAVLYNNDQAILDAFERSRGQAVYDAAVDVGGFLEPVGFMGRTNYVYVGALVAGYALRNEPLTVIPAQILESHLLAGGVRNLGKLLVPRERPQAGLGPESFEDGTSFFSGHTSIAFELATILSHHARRRPVTVLLYALATTVAMERIDSGEHWASDVLAGAVTGVAVSRAVVRLHESRAAGVALAPLWEVHRGAIRAGFALRF